MQSPLKILFIDDHAGLRDGLCFLLSQKNQKLQFITGNSYNEAKDLIRQNKDINLAIVDINLDGLSGISLVSELRNVIPNLNVIIYTMYNDPIHIEESLKANIQGYITKDAKIEELEDAIISVTKGNSYFNKQAQNIIYSLLKGESSSKSEYDESFYLFTNYKTLTKKEQEIFSLLAQKKDSWEIAKLLNKSEKTVVNQKSIIYQKMNLKDRLDLIEAAKTLGVII